MILKKIELENIKTHKKTTIPFKKGLNVFHGRNGTGKSTVLEMIGFVLFDYLERKKHNIYVREVQNDKPAFGTVRLWVIGLNNEPYIIERTIGKAGIAVYNALTNKELKQISDTSKLKKWIRKQIGVSNNVELENIFETSIGIPQGTFLVPFQKTAGKRKEYFDPILDLKIYEVMWSKLKQLLDKIYSSALQDVNLEISEISGAIKDKSEIIGKRDSAEEEVTKLTVQLTNSKDLFATLKTKVDQLRDVKTKMEMARQEVEKLTIKKDNEQETVSNLQVQVNEAKTAKKICDATQEKSKRYEELFDEQSHLQLKLSDLQQSQTELKTIAENFVMLKTKIEGIIESKLEAEEAVNQVKSLELKYNRSVEVENDINQNNEDITRIATIDEGTIIKNANLNELHSEIHRISEQVEILPELEQKISEFGDIEEKKDDLRQSIHKIEFKLAIFTQNQKELERGICPILNQQCINIKEGSANFNNLSSQIKEEEELLKEKIAQIQLVQKKLESKEQVVSKLEELNELKIKLAEKQKQETFLQGDIVTNQEKTKNKASFVTLKETLEKEKEELGPFVENYWKKKNKAEELSSLKDNLMRLEQESLQLGKAKEIKEKAVKSMEHVPTDLKKIQADLNTLREDHDLYQTNKKQADRLPKREAELQGAVNALHQFESFLKEAEGLLENFASQFDDVKFKKLENDTNACEIEIARLQTQKKERQDRVEEFNEDLNTIEKSEQELVELNHRKDKLEVQTFFITKMRVWLRAFAPKMRKALINQINMVASEIYRSLREEEGAVLAWQDDYDILVSTSKSKKNYFRLSGGEKMSAAL